jgi:hypothetical protein
MLPFDNTFTLAVSLMAAVRCHAHWTRTSGIRRNPLQ